MSESRATKKQSPSDLLVQDDRYRGWGGTLSSCKDTAGNVTERSLSYGDIEVMLEAIGWTESDGWYEVRFQRNFTNDFFKVFREKNWKPKGMTDEGDL